MEKITFLVHGKIASKAKLINEIKQVFASGRYELTVLVTEYAGHFTELAKSAAHHSSHIICAGGDGSLNESVNGVMLAVSEGANPETRVGLLPYGTGNDFARMMGITRELTELKRLIAGDNYRKIDLGLAKFKDERNSDAERYFINITDIGLGGLISKRLKNSSKFFGPTITYQGIILRTFFAWKNQLVKVKSPDFEYEGELMNLIIANGKYFGAGMGIAPDAIPDDGKFAIVVVGPISLLDYLLNLGTIKKCKPVKHPRISYFSTSKISATAIGTLCAIDMDGEFIGYAPLSIDMIPKCLYFLANA